jgi:hypothetical protein
VRLAAPNNPNDPDGPAWCVVETSPQAKYGRGPLNAAEFEDFVADVISNLSIYKNAEISRNRRYPGVRQPGSYEVDLALEFSIDGALRFLVIIECKNWSRPVDRPVVQKVVQTRDAISAQKAAIVSPVGFSREAKEVAKANGVALWVLGSGRRKADHVRGGDGIIGAMAYTDYIRKLVEVLYRQMCIEVSSVFSPSGPEREPRHIDLVVWNQGLAFDDGTYFLKTRDVAIDLDPSRGYGIDEFVCELVKQLSECELTNAAQRTLFDWKEHVRSRLVGCGFQSEIADMLIMAALTDNYAPVHDWWSRQHRDKSAFEREKIGHRLYLNFTLH